MRFVLLISSMLKLLSFLSAPGKIETFFRQGNFTLVISPLVIPVKISFCLRRIEIKLFIISFYKL
jgi:hypothetical protein